MNATACSIRIGLAEDHKLVRDGLKALLEKEPTFSIVAEASDGLEAVELVMREKPDVLLLDLRIPRLHGIEVLRQLRDQTDTRVVVVSMHADEPYIVEAIKNRVSGYVLKDSPSNDLIQAIRTAASGGQFFSEPLQRKAFHLSLRRVVPGQRSANLTKREHVVLELAAEGRTSGEIADRLFISRRTAEAHRANIMRKLGLKTQTDLVLYAVRHGIISP
jgi:DNA-binding NarL/FixJ family response regulator